MSGPHPEGLICRYVILGRIRANDQLSRDQQDWYTVAEVEDFFQAWQEGPMGETDPKRKFRSLARACERSGKDRRQEQTPTEEQRQQRSGEERRAPEAEELVQLRNAQTINLKYSPLANASAWRWVIPIIVITLGSLLWLFAIQKEKSVARSCGDLTSSPVHWNDCQLAKANLEGLDLAQANLRNANLRSARLQGVSLRGADLAYADVRSSDASYADLAESRWKGAQMQGMDLSSASLQNADLSYANLTDAQLGGADLRGARLDNAIWIDKRVCVTGSVGICR